MDIISHVYRPYVTFYYRADEAATDPKMVDPEVRHTVTFCYELGPIPKYLLDISPKFSEEIKNFDATIRSQIKTTIESSLVDKNEERDPWEYKSKVFTTNPSTRLSKIIKSARFIFDIAGDLADKVLTMLRANQALIKLIRYICIRGHEESTMDIILAYFTSLETLAIYTLDIHLMTPIHSPHTFFQHKYADRHVELGRTAAFSKLEYVFGLWVRDQATNIIRAPDIPIKYTRRRLRDEELDERGRAPFYEYPGEHYPRYLEDIVWVVDFLNTDVS
ncbi:hypothetical protein TWF694_007853 [Orbilia ellipsospora]|uniref:Uncharacterized protein n=1 Tax=Orbilia ellipsospora TaxID=2528407 RepID=A0AAV9XLJ3_9PEZI